MRAGDLHPAGWMAMTGVTGGTGVSDGRVVVVGGSDGRSVAVVAVFDGPVDPHTVRRFEQPATHGECNANPGVDVDGEA